MRERLSTWIRARREQWVWFDVFMQVRERGRAVGAGRLAAVIAYYGFFSLFPLLLVLVTVVAELFTGRWRDKIVGSALEQIPVVGEDLTNVGAVSGNGVAIAVGLAGAIWAGTHAIDAVEQALSSVWTSRQVSERGLVARRVRALAVLLVLGVGVVAAAVAGGVVSSAPVLPTWLRPLLLVPSMGINVAVLLATFVILAPGALYWRRHLTGAIVGGIGITILQAVGGFYIQRVVQGASDTYGVFAVVIGLLTWLHLMARLLVWSALLNAELAEREEAVRRGRDISYQGA